MRNNPYDSIVASASVVASVAIAKITGSSDVNGDAFDTATIVAGGLESAMVHARAEIATGSPDAATIAFRLQESDASGSGFADALDNAGNVITTGALNVHTVAQEAYFRVEGIGTNRKRYLRVVQLPAFTNGSSPGILTFAEFVAVPRSAEPVRTAVSNT